MATGEARAGLAVGDRNRGIRERLLAGLPVTDRRPEGGWRVHRPA